MTSLGQWMHSGLNRKSMEHVLRTTLAATVSLFAAQLLRLPQAYWAPITTVIVVQSTLGAVWKISVQRLIGTALGASLGALLAAYWGRGMLPYAAGLLAMSLLCALLHLDRAAYRFAGITQSIVQLTVNPQSPWIIAENRFLEVSLGIVVCL